jgi:hypothetical protein
MRQRQRGEFGQRGVVLGLRRKPDAARARLDRREREPRIAAADVGQQRGGAARRDQRKRLDVGRRRAGQPEQIRTGALQALGLGAQRRQRGAIATGRRLQNRTPPTQTVRLARRGSARIIARAHDG